MTKHILLVEDNEASRNIMQEAFVDASFEGELDVVGNGNEAMQFLRQGPRFENKPKPDLVLLDLNMPGKSGMEVLQEIKSDEALQYIPVIILSGSNAPKDMNACFGFLKCHYLLKPSRFQDLVKLVTSLEDYC